MTNGFGASGSGPGGFGAGGFGPGDYDKLVRQYWNNWGEMMRKAAAAAPAGAHGAAPGAFGMPGIPPGMPGMPAFDGTTAIPGWNEAVAWWTNLAKGAGAGAGGGIDTGVNDALDRFNSQARSWFDLMQKVAAQATPGASPGDIAQAWQGALGGLGDNPFADMFRTMRGPGQQGFDSWLEQAAPYLQGFGGWPADGKSLLGQPAFGFTREHQERWQQLMLANIDYQQHSQAYNALMAEAAQNAFKRFETRLAERTEPGRQLESARALFDLWIEAAEDAYAEIALSPRFREAYGAMVNSQMRLRAGLQREVEEVCELFGMPTRTEVDSSHRKLVQVERELRRIRDALEALGGLDQLVARSAAASVEPAHKRRAPQATAKNARPVTGVRGASPRQRPVSTAAPGSSKIASAKPIAKTAQRRTATATKTAKKVADKSAAKRPTATGTKAATAAASKAPKAPVRASRAKTSKRIR